MRSARYAHDAIHDRLRLYSTTSNISINGVKCLKRDYPPTQSIPETNNNSNSILPCIPLESNNEGEFYDPKTGRKIVLKGINVDSQSKLPVNPNTTSYCGNCTESNNIFFDGDKVSFVGRPFPIDEAKSHFQRIKSWGYNTIRYVLTWEAIEHEGPGKYDQDFANYTIEILKIIGEIGGLYIFLDLHQDVWSRYSGGSGAPMWTFYSVGLNPKNFSMTEAAILHNEPRFHDSTDIYHKMLWTSNYKRLASLVMFTAFFAGKNYFPNFFINDENIQDYLQNKFFGAVEFIWMEILKGVPNLIENGTIMGFESMNEPNCGLIGYPNLNYIPNEQQLRVGTTPTAFQSMKLGMGYACEVDEYRISVTGPRKYATKIIDPKGIKAWLTPEEGEIIDKHYGFKRNEAWELGKCIFALQGIWDWPVNDTPLEDMTQAQRLEISSKCLMLQSEFFSKSLPIHKYPNKISKIDVHTFVNFHFVNFYIKFKETIRKHNSKAWVMLSVPVLEQPPDLKNDERNIIDSKTIYCPHYYDGLSLMFKSWNNKYNVDTLGIMRGCYINPVLGIVFGERAIRNCIRKQFIEMRNECEKYLGPIPVLMSETGMPFDMDDKRSYRNGKYISQTAALDAISNALEGANMSHTYWCYNSSNNHKWGDHWNNEDFSFWSMDDRNLSFADDEDTSPLNSSNPPPKRKNSVVTLKAKRKLSAATKMGFSSSKNSVISTNSESSFDKDTEYESDDTSSQSSIISTTPSNVYHRQYRKCYPSPDGVRAASAVIRPYMIATKGKITASEFDIKSVKFSLQIAIDFNDIDSPTIIFVPKWHYPFLEYGDVYLTSGYIKYNEELEYIEWHHGIDPQKVPEDGEPELQKGVSIETIIIKNNSGSLEEAALIEEKGESSCPVT
ncbi:uncharacterized protein KGF55_005679 [Candida pseudojiufengensis]|uniref:uncharacterized protein n=1 Tax=Candida pseudojiufengensis TaxID=497109 RepID=UPI002224CE8F|nr:uncharacterized protein KGF55_005679 [Candida pseudojiufengensis]KAI5958681.1 hypothetical protein KGF55_005679 [Candida pseudojiufengensis]